MSQMGAWAVDRIVDNKIGTAYLKTREEANKYTASQEEGLTLRRVNLEGAFLKLTGKKVK